MTDKEPSDMSRNPARGSEGDAHKDLDPVRSDDETAGPHEPDRYSPRHRAPGRPPLIRRRRNKEGESEEVTWETPWMPTDDDPPRWTEEEASALAPPPAPIDEVPLGPSRPQHGDRGGAPSSEEERGLVRRSRDYTGKHLAPRKGGLFGRGARPGTEVSTGDDERQDQGPAAEGDVEAGEAAAAERATVRQEAVRTNSDRTVAQGKAAPEAHPPPPQGPPAPREPQPGALRHADGPDEGEDAPAGPRRAALQERKKKKLRWTAAGAITATAVAIGGIAGAGLIVKNVVDPQKERVAVPFQQLEEETLGGTTLVFGTKEASSSGRGAIWMTLLTLDPDTGKGSVVYIPPHTAVEVPGRGLQGVGEAYGSGGVPLLLISTENLLGVKIDRYLELSDKDALVFFENLDAMTVDVPAEVRVPAGKDQARLIFVDGPQELSPGLLVKLLYVVGIDGDDVELGSRHLAFWDELLDVYADGSELATAVEKAGPALGESDASPEEHAAFLAALADLPPEDLTITALPVRPVSAGDSELYATDEAELASFVEETIGLDQERPQEIRVQVLNGNGVPGIGQEVADQLVGEGFRVILSGNARRLNYRKTLVVAYDDSEAGIALAERARDLLGVGEVQVSAQQQGIVDLTIVVGKDFLRAP